MADSFFSSSIKMPQSSSHFHPPKLRSVGSSVHLNLLPINNPDEEIGPYSYDKNRKLGSGYSSKVYLGRKKNTCEEFAIKVDLIISLFALVYIGQQNIVVCISSTKMTFYQY